MYALHRCLAGQASTKAHRPRPAQPTSPPSCGSAMTCGCTTTRHSARPAPAPRQSCPSTSSTPEITARWVLRWESAGCLRVPPASHHSKPLNPGCSGKGSACPHASSHGTHNTQTSKIVLAFQTRFAILNLSTEHRAAQNHNGEQVRRQNLESAGTSPIAGQRAVSFFPTNPCLSVVVMLNGSLVTVMHD